MNISFKSPFWISCPTVLVSAWTFLYLVPQTNLKTKQLRVKLLQTYSTANNLKARKFRVKQNSGALLPLGGTQGNSEQFQTAGSTHLQVLQSCCFVSPILQPGSKRASESCKRLAWKWFFNWEITASSWLELGFNVLIRNQLGFITTSFVFLKCEFLYEHYDKFASCVNQNLQVNHLISLLMTVWWSNLL